MKTMLTIICALLLLSPSVSAQSVEIKVKEDVPLTDFIETGGQTRGLASPRKSVQPDKYTVRYIQVNPGPAGMIRGLSPDKAMDRAYVGEFNFPSLYITISVAARLVPALEDLEVGRMEGALKFHTELKQMCVNLRVSALDDNKNTIVQAVKATQVELNANDVFLREFGKEPLLTLGIAPYESMFAQVFSQQSKFSDSAQVASSTASSVTGSLSRTLDLSDTLETVASFVNPLGTLVSGVSAIFKILTPIDNSPNQISYMSSPNEFGWIWRQAQGYGIEGIHNCMALIRTHKSVKYILAEVELITDWKRFGAWVKKIDYIVPIVGAE